MTKMSSVFFIVIFFLFNSLAFANDPIDFGAMWRAWGQVGQSAYFWGFIDGTTKHALFAMDEYKSMGHLTKECNQSIGTFIDTVNKKTATKFDEKKLMDIITHLYDDPVNSYIWVADMVLIARDSLSGKDVSKALREAREMALKTHDLNEKMRDK